MGMKWASLRLNVAADGLDDGDAQRDFDFSTVGFTLVRTIIDIHGSFWTNTTDDLEQAGIAPTRWAILEYGSEINPLPHFEFNPDSNDGGYFLGQGQIGWASVFSYKTTSITGPASIDLSGNLTYDLTVHGFNVLSCWGSDHTDSQGERKMTEEVSGLLLITDNQAAPSAPSDWRNGGSGLWATARVLFKTP